MPDGKRLLMGRIGAAHGIKGEVRIQSFTDEPLALVDYREFSTNRPGLSIIIERARALKLPDRYDRMALDRGLANLMRAQRDLTADVLAVATGPVPARIAAWQTARQAAIERTASAVAELTEGEGTVSRLTVAAGLLSDLARGT